MAPARKLNQIIYDLFLDKDLYYKELLDNKSLNFFTAMQNTIKNVYGIPVVKAIKLCRVLITYGKKPVAQKLDNFKIIQAILTYISETG